LKNRIQYLSDYDDLVTKLPNRRVLNNLVSKTIGQLPSDQSCYFLFIDVDDLKSVNRKLGYKTGDRLLFLIAQRMLDFLSYKSITSVPARIGGDEFGLVLADTKESIAIFAAEMIADIRRPLEIDGADYLITASIGIAIYPTDATTVDELVFSAEQAMFSAKDRGKNTYVFFNQTH
jgi:diguanylate cyclase (GGDEF)-like protein